MTDTARLAPLADALAQSRRDHIALDPTRWAPLLSSDEDAYAVQGLVGQRAGWPAEADARCWKCGGPSRTATLTNAPLPPAGIRNSPATLGDLRFHRRGIEAEIALRLGRDVAPDDARAMTPETAPQWVDAMAVSIEVVDSRWIDPMKTPRLLNLADLQVHGALVLGDWQPYAPRDWAAQSCSVTLGVQAPKTFTGTHSLADPAWLLPAWLRHATRQGATVRAGTVVTTGTWCGLLMAQAGDRVVVRFDGIGAAELVF